MQGVFCLKYSLCNLNLCPILPKQHLSSVVRVERKIIFSQQGFGIIPTRKSNGESRADFASGYSLAVLAVNLLLTKGQIGMDRKRMEENSDYLPKAGNPMNETVWYKIGGTYYEVETSCGGSEPLYDKLVRLLKSETFADPADKEEKARYNDGSNLFVGRSLQEE